MKKNKLYVFLLIACFIGYCWLLFSINYEQQNNVSVCLVKNVTSIPCPSCGSTRAVSQLVKGNFLASIHTNPFGVIILVIMIVAPIWILFDFILKKNTFYQFYKKTEAIIRKKPIAIILIFLVLLNWYWNIKKGL